jgi:hypothetical protein
VLVILLVSRLRFVIIMVPVFVLVILLVSRLRFVIIMVPVVGVGYTVYHDCLVL